MAPMSEHAATTTVPDDRLALLCFGRNAVELFEVLFASPLATRMVAAGVDPRPERAGGEFILAEGETEV